MIRTYAAFLLVSNFAVVAASAGEPENTDYIQKLTYDLPNLLSVSLAPTSQKPPPAYNERSNAVVICTKKKHTATGRLTENALLDPSGDVVFPGALVKMDRRLAEGLPTPITLRRAPIKIRVDLPGLGEDGEKVVQNPTNVSVSNAISQIVDRWHTRGRKEGYGPAIRAFYEAKTAYTNEQIGIELGFSGQWSSTTMSTAVDLQRSTEQTVVMKAFKQVYFTASIEEPPTAGSVFHESVKLNPGNMSANSPPGLVRSVDYGRILIVTMVTNSAHSAVNAKAALEYTTGRASFDINSKTKYDKIANNSTFKVLALGGAAEDAKVLFSGDPKEIVQVIEKGIEFSKQNPAYPIAYKVADLKTREIARMSVSTDYIETDCQEYANGWVELQHHGAYVAKFYVSYKHMDKKGNTKTTLWKSGKKTAGWSQKIWFPGDAWDIRIKGQVMTGLVWDPWKNALDIRPSAIPNACYKIYGTTLGRKSGKC